MHHHSGTSTEHGDRPQKPTVNLEKLQTPTTDLGIAQRAIDKAVDEKIKYVNDTIVAHLQRNDCEIGNALCAWHADNKDKSQDQVIEVIKAYKKDMIEKATAAIPTLLDYSKLTVPAGIQAEDLKTECEKQKETAIALAVDQAVRQVIKDIRDKSEIERRKTLQEVKSTRFTNFTREGLKKWIESARVDDAQKQLAADIGIDSSPLISLKTHRGALLTSLVGCHALAGVFLYAWGGAEASPWLAGLTCFNFAVQCIGGMKFNHRTKVLFERTFAAAKDAPDMESAVFWTGQLARLMKEQNPLFLAKNRTDLLNSEKATHLDTVARHLQEAAAYAGQRIAEDVSKNPMGFTQKDMVINGFLDKAKADLDTFIERWNAPASNYRSISAWTAGIASLPWIIPLLTKIL